MNAPYALQSEIEFCREPESSGLLGQYKCSSCNDTVHVASLKVLKRLHYCPNCGARVVDDD